jgi:hypothetical protein
MKRSLAVAVVALALSACASRGSLTDGVSLAVRSYDPGSGSYELQLRNNTSRPVLYLNPYLIFHDTRRSEPEGFPSSPEGSVLMVHDTKLAAGASVTFTGTCTAQGTCSRKPTYVAVLACWFTDAFTCKEYLPVWSESPLNGA